MTIIVEMQVEVATQRPLKNEPDRISKVIVFVPIPVETHEDLFVAENYARLMATYMVAVRPDVEMVTACKILNILM